MGALIPVAWGLLSGEEPGPVVIVGVAIAVIAAGLIAQEPGEHDGAPATRSIVIALLAGIGLGTSLVLYGQTGSDSGLWPVLSARVMAAVVAGVAVLIVVRSGSVRLPSEPRRLAIGAGIADVAATAFLVYGIRHDLAVVVAPLAALGPGFTVMLAWAVLREPVSRHQVFGLVLALVGLALITAG
jgi:drug/metabolite transporter (DMT)-like permease